MGRYTQWATSIFESMDEILQFCKDVQEADRCEECQLKKCLCYDSMKEVFEECTIRQIEDFMQFADGVLITDEDILADIANDARQDEAVYGT